MISRIARSLFLFTFTALCTLAPAEVKLPNIFGDNMVLQRDVDLPVWGWASPGEKVNVEIAGKTAEATADTSGTWKLKIAPLAVGGPHTMTVRGSSEITFKNILIGEVWLCSGQSNMDMGINQVLDAAKEREQANYPEIHFFEVPYLQAPQPRTNCGGKWQVCTSETIGQGGFFGSGFSAAGYFFARDIHKELKVPVGMIKSSLGGTRIEPWTPPEGFELHPQFADIVKTIRESTPKHRAAMIKTVAESDTWLKKAHAAIDSGADIPSPPEWPKHELDDNKKPTSLYNAMIHPLVPYAIRGALWYQGESNRQDKLKYTDLMRALVDGWRKIWGSSEMPFYYVQIAPFRYAEPSDWTTLLWEAQVKALAIPNTGMVVTTDLVDNIQDIHPKMKKEVGARLAQLALAKTYGRTGIVYSGPLFESARREGNAMRVQFKFGEGLKSRDGKALDWFELAGADQKFMPAQARVDGDTLLVTSDKVQEPVAVRFAWNQEAQPNLANGAGLPASPFRSDSW